MNDDGCQRLMNLRTFIFSGLKFLAAMLVFFLTIEICARLDDAIKYGAPLLRGYSYSDLQSKDNDGIRYNVPGARFEKWHHNSLGFRGPEVVKNKPSGVIRIVCMGTSESYGLYENPGKEWPFQLQSILGNANYEVINASIVGLNLPLFDVYLKKHVLPLNPDIIVLIINPLFYLTTLERKDLENNTLPRTERRMEVQTVSLTTKLIKNIRIGSKIKQVCKQALMNNFPGTLKRYQLWNLKRQIEGIERIRLNGEKPKDLVPDIHLVSFHKELSKLVESIHSQGIEVMLSSSPALISHGNISQYPEIFLDNRRFFIEFSLEGMIDSFMQGNLIFAAVAAEQSTMFADSAALLQKSTDYFSDNVHFTDKGAQLIAEAVAAQILSNQSARIITRTQIKRKNV